LKLIELIIEQTVILALFVVGTISAPQGRTGKDADVRIEQYRNDNKGDGKYDVE
jgi:hypothetical protein